MKFYILIDVNNVLKKVEYTTPLYITTDVEIFNRVNNSRNSGFVAVSADGDTVNEAIENLNKLINDDNEHPKILTITTIETGYKFTDNRTSLDIMQVKGEYHISYLDDYLNYSISNHCDGRLMKVMS